MMMAIAARNQRQVQLFLEAALFIQRERNVSSLAALSRLFFFLTSLICSFIQWTTPNLIPVSLIHHTGCVSSLSFSLCLCLSPWLNSSHRYRSSPMMKRITQTSATVSMNLSVYLASAWNCSFIRMQRICCLVFPRCLCTTQLP